MSQARNQEFFRGGEFDKYSPITRERKAPQGKKSPIFSPANS